MVDSILFSVGRISGFSCWLPKKYHSTESGQRPLLHDADLKVPSFLLFS
jgi:hypothetical protein